MFIGRYNHETGESRWETPGCFGDWDPAWGQGGHEDQSEFQDYEEEEEEEEGSNCKPGREPGTVEFVDDGSDSEGASGGSLSSGSSGSEHGSESSASSGLVSSDLSGGGENRAQEGDAFESYDIGGGREGD